MKHSRSVCAALSVASVLAWPAAAQAETVIGSVKYNFGSQEWKLEAKFVKQEIDYATDEPAGTVIINTRRKYLYLILGNGRAMRYGIGVGRDGFKWYGEEKISRKAEWPDWHPPVEMVERDELAAKWANGMPGGPDNPLGARALYLGNSLYRIHGTTQPWTIGTAVSSGCIRLQNEDVIDLYERVAIGAKVIVQ
ncbi:MAG: L,D-transpeptidase [Parvibaculaceae bacterium]